MMSLFDKVKKAGNKIADGIGDAVDELKADAPAIMTISIERYEELLEIEKKFIELIGVDASLEGEN